MLGLCFLLVQLIFFVPPFFSGQNHEFISKDQVYGMVV
jgi:hypothetical protein